MWGVAVACVRRFELLPQMELPTGVQVSVCVVVCVWAAHVCVFSCFCAPKGSYLENAFVDLLATMAQRQVPVASWLNAVHESAREAHLTSSGSSCMPEHTTFAGRRSTPEVSTAVTSNRLCAMLAPDGAYEECDMLRASAEAGPHIVAGVNDVAPPGKAQATALMFAALAVSSRKLDERTAGPHASAVLSHEVYRRRGVESALRVAAKSRVEAFADSGKHFVSVVLVVPGYTSHFVEAVTPVFGSHGVMFTTIGAVRVVPGCTTDDVGAITSEFGPHWVTFTATGDVRVVITLPMLVGAFALGKPGTAAGVVRGVLPLICHNPNADTTSSTVR